MGVMANAAARLVRSIVKNNNVAVFSKSYCPFCKLAKDVLSAAGATDMEVIELDLRKDGDDVQTELKTITGQSTVPHVFIKQSFVGGGTDVEKLHSIGKLETLISKL